MADPDFRSLCAELVSAFDCVSDSEDSSGYERLKDAIEEARAALSQPAPVPPTDEELYELWISGNWYNEGATLREFKSIARAALVRWGQGNG
jgi:hypothetical protein